MAYLNIRVGDTLAHWYQDDDCWHERRALWRVKEGVWAIYTPEADLYVEDLRGLEDGPSRCKIKGTHFRYWSRVGGPSYKFASPIGEEELKLLIRRGYETARHEDAFDPEWLPDQVVVGDTVRGFDELFGGSFLPRRLKMKQPRRQVDLPLDEGAGVGQTDPGPSFLTALPATEGPARDTPWQPVIPDPAVDLALDSRMGVAKVSGRWARVELVMDKDFDMWKSRRAEELNNLIVSEGPGEGPGSLV